MKIADYISSHEGDIVAPEVLHASLYLEKHGEIFLVNFDLNNAITKAAEMFVRFLDEDIDWMEERRMVRSEEIHGEWT